ncbi:unnamed protein product [Penicillium nalgiovense]|nr:unnamed protein product [Penicillium nalgiovense]
MQFLFPKKHKHHMIVLWLMAGEFPLTIVMLTLTGIASHDLYRTLLWQDGADNGFNSAPNEALYAAANYQPFKAPMVWSDFITDYNLVMGVLSTFFLITKLPTHWMKLFYPPVAVAVHGSLIILYIVSAAYQAGSDTSDPRHPQPGAPWYIAKSCSVASKKSNIPYCMQAKALFAVTILMIVYYAVILGFNIHSCFITPEEREAILEQREERRIEKEFEEEIIKSPSMIPMTPAQCLKDQAWFPAPRGFRPSLLGEVSHPTHPVRWPSTDWAMIVPPRTFPCGITRARLSPSTRRRNRMKSARRVQQGRRCTSRRRQRRLLRLEWGLNCCS